jgi:hypothetical protein
MNPFIFTIIAAVIGSGLLVAGAAAIYHPAGLLVAGALLILAAHGSTRMPRRPEN